MMKFITSFRYQTEGVPMKNMLDGALKEGLNKRLGMFLTVTSPVTRRL